MNPVKPDYVYYPKTKINFIPLEDVPASDKMNHISTRDNSLENEDKGIIEQTKGTNIENYNPKGCHDQKPFKIVSINNTIKSNSLMSFGNQLSSNHTLKNPELKLIVEILLSSSKLSNVEENKNESKNEMFDIMDEYLKDKNTYNYKTKTYNRFDRKCFTFIFAEYFGILSRNVATSVLEKNSKQLFLEILKKLQEMIVDGTGKKKRVYLLICKNFVVDFFKEIFEKLLEKLNVYSNFENNSIKNELEKLSFSLINPNEGSLLKNAIDIRDQLYNKYIAKNSEEFNLFKMNNSVIKLNKIIHLAQEYFKKPEEDSDNENNYKEYKKKWMKNIDEDENILTKTVKEIINSENVTHINKKYYFKIKKEVDTKDENTDNTNKSPSLLKCKRKKDKNEFCVYDSKSDSSTKTSNISSS